MALSRYLGLLALGSLPVAVLAYNLDGSRWPGGESTFSVDIPGSAPSGVTWNQAFEDALAQWSDETAFSFLVNSQYQDPCEGYSESDEFGGFPAGNGDSFNGADFANDVCGNEFGQGVLAITLTLSFQGNLGFSLISQTDILFNDSFEWDIYSGPRRSEIDFRRVALHELGHAIGLGHEDSEPALMSSTISEIDSLQADDIEGVNSLYGGPGDCQITSLGLNTVVEGALEDGDCAVLELYGGGDDTSFVDAYRLNLDEETTLNIMMESAALDSVLLLTDDRLNGIDFDDDSLGGCDAIISGSFPAGEYLLLANTYVEPVKCPGNTGSYKISISDNALPILSKARSASGATSKSIFLGGATADQGESYKSSFLASDTIDVDASIIPDSAHTGEPATFYMVAFLSTGHKFAKTANGKFEQISGLSSIPAFASSDNLAELETFSILRNLNAEALGISGITLTVFIGYSLESSPSEIYFNGKPITVTVQ